MLFHQPCPLPLPPNQYHIPFWCRESPSQWWLCDQAPMFSPSGVRLQPVGLLSNSDGVLIYSRCCHSLLSVQNDATRLSPHFSIPPSIPTPPHFFSFLKKNSRARPEHGKTLSYFFRRNERKKDQSTQWQYLPTFPAPVGSDHFARSLRHGRTFVPKCTPGPA